MINTFYVALFVLFAGSPANDQNDCKVLMESISGIYDGECKKGVAEGIGTARGTDTYVGAFEKGLPHGQGRYIWQNGNYYSGDFVKGAKEGYGEMTIKREGRRDSLYSGYWIKDTFVGTSNVPYKVVHTPNIKNVTFEQVAEKGAEIMIVVSRNKQSVVADGLRLTNDQEIKSLSEFDYTVLRKIEFPFTGVTMDFRSQAPVGSTILEYHVEFDIFEKGRWLVTIEVY